MTRWKREKERDSDRKAKTDTNRYTKIQRERERDTEREDKSENIYRIWTFIAIQ